MAPVYAATPTPRLPSAIGDRSVVWLAVSPSYVKNGIVVAVATQKYDCYLRECTQVWLTKDKGATWMREKATGFTGARPVITIDAAGHETLYSEGDNLQRSDDYGDTWVDAGPGPNGSPTPVPNSPEGAVAVAGGASDYILSSNAVKPVKGSGGALDDKGFAFAPHFPDSGSFPPALLVSVERATRRPIIQQCKTDLSCTGNTVLVGSAYYGISQRFFFSADYARDGVVFTKTQDTIYKSTDGGVSFTALKLADNAATATLARMMAVSPDYREAGPVRTAYVALTQVFLRAEVTNRRSTFKAGAVYKTSDGGNSWQVVGSPGPLDTGVTAVAVAPDGRVFAGYIKRYDGGLLCSTDGGNDWRESCPSGPVVNNFVKPQKLTKLDVVKIVILGLLVLTVLAIVISSVQKASRKPA
jgi:hypothetical protein